MNEIVGKYNILFLCLDTLRFDVAAEEEACQGTPNLNRYGPWAKCHAPGNFTYPSHHAMFAGFLPSPAAPVPMMERDILFFPKNIGLGNHPPEGAFAFEGSTFVEGLEKVVPKVEIGKHIFMYLNVDAIHYPNYFYEEGETQDSKKTHGAALRYVDERVERLFDVFRKRGNTFVILCSDHGTCYGEDGYYFHNISHEVVYTVPYKQFFI